jgi:hypothetical protein
MNFRTSLALSTLVGASFFGFAATDAKAEPPLRYAYDAAKNAVVISGCNTCSDVLRLPPGATEVKVTQHEVPKFKAIWLAATYTEGKSEAVVSLEEPKPSAGAPGDMGKRPVLIEAHFTYAREEGKRPDSSRGKGQRLTFEGDAFIRTEFAENQAFCGLSSKVRFREQLSADGSRRFLPTRDISADEARRAVPLEVSRIQPSAGEGQLIDDVRAVGRLRERIRFFPKPSENVKNDARTTTEVFPEPRMLTHIAIQRTRNVAGAGSPEVVLVALDSVVYRVTLPPNTPGSHGYVAALPTPLEARCMSLVLPPSQAPQSKDVREIRVFEGTAVAHGFTEEDRLRPSELLKLGPAKLRSYLLQAPSVAFEFAELQLQGKLQTAETEFLRTLANDEEILFGVRAPLLVALLTDKDKNDARSTLLKLGAEERSQFAAALLRVAPHRKSGPTERCAGPGRTPRGSSGAPAGNERSKSSPAACNLWSGRARMERGFAVTEFARAFQASTRGRRTCERHETRPTAGGPAARCLW